MSWKLYRSSWPHLQIVFTNRFDLSALCYNHISGTVLIVQSRQRTVPVRMKGTTIFTNLEKIAQSVTFAAFYISAKLAPPPHLPELCKFIQYIPYGISRNIGLRQRAAFQYLIFDGLPAFLFIHWCVNLASSIKKSFLIRATVHNGLYPEIGAVMESPF